MRTLSKGVSIQEKWRKMYLRMMLEWTVAYYEMVEREVNKMVFGKKKGRGGCK